MFEHERPRLALSPRDTAGSAAVRLRNSLSLGKLRHTRGDKPVVVTHLRAARDRFGRLSVPRWVERVTKLADYLGVSID